MRRIFCNSDDIASSHPSLRTVLLYMQLKEFDVRIIVLDLCDFEPRTCHCPFYSLWAHRSSCIQYCSNWGSSV